MTRFAVLALTLAVLYALVCPICRASAKIFN